MDNTLYTMVKKAIGPKNQKKIALAIGIDPATLSRKLAMLKNSDGADVDIALIKRIADVTDPTNGVSRQELYAAAGIPYEDLVLVTKEKIKHIIESYLQKNWYTREVPKDLIRNDMEFEFDFVFDGMRKKENNEFVESGRLGFLITQSETGESESQLLSRVGSLVTKIIYQAKRKTDPDKLKQIFPEYAFLVVDKDNVYESLEPFRKNFRSGDTLRIMLINMSSRTVKIDEPFGKL